MNKEKVKINKPWNLPVSTLYEKFSTSPSGGLSKKQVSSQKRIYGQNRLREVKSRSAWRVFVDQIANLIMLLLLTAAALSFYLHDWIEGFAIVAVMLLTALIGFFTEIRAVRAMESLREMSRVNAVVIRDSETRKIPAMEIVPGDILLFEGGDIVTADVRLFEANKLQADESALTGESVPVKKNVTELNEDTPLAERTNMLFKGTAVTSGSAKGIVTATGMDTELGNISDLVASAEQEVTPLEKRLDRLGRKLIWLTLGIAAAVAGLGIIHGKALYMMIETSIALAVAAIPEGLPIVATVALARGMIRMSKKNVLINRLSSVETLGATNVIFTDKTGTLTENKMTVTQIAFDNGLLDINSEKDNKKNFILNKTEIDPLSNSLVECALQIAVLNNNASLHNNKDDGKSRGVGDPLEIALLAAGAGAGLYRDKLLEKWPEEREDAFDSESKMMATIHKKNGDYLTTVKGAPEAVIEHSSAIITANGPEEFSKDKKKEWLEKNEKMANDGLRILAIANKEMSKTDDDPYKDLQFLGLVGLLDPPRQEILGVLDLCKQAGIRVNMVTGDQAATALYIAKKINLSTNNKVITGRELKKSDDMNKEETQQVIDTSIFARVSPAQKLDLITVHQNNNSIVAMTGDGVNDAPALKKADIGVSMGKRGTQVAQEASDMVLKDDAFPSIVTAVEYGRIIFNNIRKFILFLLSGNVGEVLAVGFASFMGLPLPLLPLQILFINLVMDVFPALALGVGAAHEDVMKNPPRQPDEPVINSYYWKMIAFFGLVIAVSVLAALGVSTDMLHLTKERAVTISFLTLALARLWHIFNMREPGSPFFKNEVTRNPFVWGAIFLCAFLVLMTVYVPVINEALKLTKPDAGEWALILFMSILPLIIGQSALFIIRKYK